MGWEQIFALFIANAGLIIWFRAESRNDWRHMDHKLDSYMNAIRQDINAIQEEIKDFHNRLCKIEERNKDKA